MSDEVEVPEDLGLKIGTKRQAWWDNIKRRTEENILNSQESIVADQAILELANKIIAEEEAKNK